jgi:hypothetical protein
LRVLNKKLSFYMKKKILIISALILVVIAVVGYNIIYKEHRDIKTEQVEFTLTAGKLFNEFSANESQATAKYADKTIAVTGKVTSVDKASGTVSIDEILSATMLDKTGDVPQKQQVKIKGRFVGYDDLLGELKMDQVTLIK